MKAMSSATYAATADHFDDPALSFWDRFGRQTVARIGLRPGDRVLDACCGTGASALPAAHAVGATRRVLGCDLSAPALTLARAKAAAQGLTDTAAGRPAGLVDHRAGYRLPPHRRAPRPRSRGAGTRRQPQVGTRTPRVVYARARR
jgi:SAM-dependent methyltransferase